MSVSEGLFWTDHSGASWDVAPEEDDMIVEPVEV
jgi:hypothetical protein